MKIVRAVIENFRHIEKLELDFTDSLDRVRDLTLLVGPNACGKTTVLNALAAALGPSCPRWEKPSRTRHSNGSRSNMRRSACLIRSSDLSATSQVCRMSYSATESTNTDTMV